jgi:hypothetical protein
MLRRSTMSFAPYAGYVCVAAEWSALAYYFFRYPQYFDGTHPLSYFATLPDTRIVFSICYLIAATSFVVFARYHLPTRYRTPSNIFTVTMVAFGALALYPVDLSGTVHTTIHNLLAQASFSGFLMGMLFMAYYDTIAAHRRITMGAFCISAALVIGYMLLPTGSPFTLGFEVGAWLAIQFWTLYISWKSRSRNHVSS